MIRAVTIPAVWVAACMASAGMAEVKLEYRHPQGSHWKIQTTAKDHQVVTINGMDLETRVETATTSTSSIGTRKPDGTLPMRRKIESLRVQMALPGGTTISFNSADVKPPAKSKIPQIAALEDLYRAMAGAEFTFILGKDQKVIAVEGAQQVLNKASESSKEAMDLLKSLVDPERLKRAFDQEFANLPDHPVHKGETWERTEVADIGGSQTLTFQNRYEYQGTVRNGGKTLDQIGVKAIAVTYAMDPSSKSAIKVTHSNLKVESSRGTILFDRAVGMAVERSGETRITGDLTLSANGMEIPAKLDLTLELQTKVEKQ